MDTYPVTSASTVLRQASIRIPGRVSKILRAPELDVLTSISLKYRASQRATGLVGTTLLAVAFTIKVVIGMTVPEASPIVTTTVAAVLNPCPDPRILTVAVAPLGPVGNLHVPTTTVVHSSRMFNVQHANVSVTWQNIATCWLLLSVLRGT